MVISYKKSLSLEGVKIKIDDIELQRVTEIKYLEVIIDDKLNIDSNTNFIGRLSNQLKTNNKILL
jgi:hypothetical protein